MTIDPISPESLPPPVVAFRKKGQPLLAWVAIVALVVYVVWHNVRPPAEANAGGGDGGDNAALEMQGRFLVGAAQAQQGLGQSNHELASQVASLNTGPIGQRLRAIVLVGELDGPKQALRQLEEFDRYVTSQGRKLTPGQQEVRDILSRLYRDYAAEQWTAPSVTEAERVALRERLGWFGALALAPAKGPDSTARAEALGSASRAFVALIGFTVWFLVFGVAGLIGLVLFVVRLFQGRVRLRLETGSPAGGVYAETFALWMALFLALSYGASKVPAGEFRFLLLGGVMLLSLAALAWPVLRGFSWQQVRQEIGLTSGHKPLVESTAGVATYALALPLLFVGILLMLLLIRLQSQFPGRQGGLPTHPIAESVGHIDWWGCVQIFFLGSVVAPLVEETMFRGVLYRHLREASGRLGRLFSVLLSATIVSFVFAVIHPQGFVAVPALMALAYAFSLAREWRGTLLPAMIAHGINNGAVFTLLILAMGP
jgi:membrane protease YdiL (CAAX protease family)